MHTDSISISAESLLNSAALESKVDKVFAALESKVDKILIDSTDEKSTQLKGLLESLKLFEM